MIFWINDKFYIFCHFNIKEMLENLYKNKEKVKEMIVKMKDLMTCYFFIIKIDESDYFS